MVLRSESLFQDGYFSLVLLDSSHLETKRKIEIVNQIVIHSGSSRGTFWSTHTLASVFLPSFLHSLLQKTDPHPVHGTVEAAEAVVRREWVATPPIPCTRSGYLTRGRNHRKTCVRFETRDSIYSLAIHGHKSCKIFHEKGIHFTFSSRFRGICAISTPLFFFWEPDN